MTGPCSRSRMPRLPMRLQPDTLTYCSSFHIKTSQEEHAHSLLMQNLSHDAKAPAKHYWRADLESRCAGFWQGICRLDSAIRWRAAGVARQLSQRRIRQTAAAVQLDCSASVQAATTGSGTLGMTLCCCC